MQMSIRLNAHVYTMCMSGGCKREMDLLELDLLKLMSCHVGAGNWSEVLYKSSKCS